MQNSLNDQLLPIDLLDKLITLKGEDGTTSQIGGKIYKQYKEACSLLSPQKRLKKATNRQTEQSLTTRQAMKASLGESPMIEEIRKRRRFSIKQAQKEFLVYSLFRIGESIKGFQEGRQSVSANFAEIAQLGSPDIERQDLMLRGIDLFLSYQKKKSISIALTDCAVLNNKKLSLFLSQDLKHLDLRDSLVKGDMVETISSHCTNLREFYLSGCYKLQAVENRKLIFSEPLKFPNLSVFDIARCNNLKILKINAPNLRVLKANNNVKLKDLNIAELCPKLKKLCLSECHQIQALENNDSQDLNFPELEVLHINKCDKLERLKINAPKLRVLKTNDNFELKELHLSGCHQIQALENKKGNNLIFPELDVLHIVGCDKLKRLKIHAPSLRVLKVDNNINFKKIYVVPFLVDLIGIDSCPLLQKTVFRNKAFGKKEWEKYFGDIGEEPPLPKNIEEILNASCSFWPSKKVKETHLLVLIPNTVNEKLFTINSLEELIQKPKYGYATKYDFYSSYVKESIGDRSYPSHWVLLTRDIIPNSRYKSYSHCFQLIADHRKKAGLPYELPNLLDATTSILMHYVRTGERLYSDSPCTYTFNQGVNEDGDFLIVGGFASGGLRIRNSIYFGLAGCCKL